MKRLIIILSLFVIGISGCVLEQKPASLDYKIDGTTFHLFQSCIEHFTPKEENQTIFIKVRNNADCSQPFDLLLKKNIGKTLTVFFNGKPVLKDTHIFSPVRTENGFYQAVESKYMFDKLVNT
ncbi:hypothetical protein, partial [Xenorhabdus bovienii]|uniref:hypothetical protein n=1 Tax=Xenorhabdus bovienii TaxID=40576 RepID=UPI0023B2FC8C